MLQNMKQRDKKRIVQTNHSLMQYLAPKQNNNQKIQRPNKIKVPNCSGSLPQCPPLNNILKYPKNPEVRFYQLEIVSHCVCTNTLVCLPTGLGKTHIAAVLIANFINWFPDKKVIFLAPTRPLVRQQVSALNSLREQIPREVVLQVNGQLAARKRQQLYDTFRVIFGTPQTIENDIKAGKLDKSKIILLIFDECHRSTGQASYSKIIRLLNDLKSGFRIIGLSATPGYEHQKVQNVISSLNITKVIYKDEKDPDVKSYLNEKKIFEIEIKSGDIIRQITQILDHFAKPSLSMLVRLNLVSPWIVKNGIKSTSFFLIRQEFNKKLPTLMFKHKAAAYAALKTVYFFIQARIALNQRGFDTFRRNFFSSLIDIVPKYKENKEQTVQKSTSKNDEINLNMVLQDPDYNSQISNSIFQNVQNEQSKSLISPAYNQDSVKQSQKMATKLSSKFQNALIQTAHYKRLYQLFFQRKEAHNIHPKLQKLIQILKNFFKQESGKAIVFTNNRVTAKQIHQYLSHIPQVKSQMFFGQSKTIFQQNEQESSIIYLKQKDQIRIIQKFKKGEINTLISTCIGEEGLDIGEVDCIICYDGGHSPIRAIQRRGRTGRKRAGSVYFLLMQGKQFTDYKNGLKKQTKMKNMLTKQLQSFQYYPYNSTLFQQKTQIIIELYDNKIAQEQEVQIQEKVKKQTKIKKNRHEIKDIEDVETKKKRGRKSRRKQEQIQIQIKTTKLDDLLDKYTSHQQQEESLEDNQIQSSSETDKNSREQDTQSRKEQQTIQEVSNQQQCSQSLRKLSINQHNQQPSKQNIQIELNQQKRQQKEIQALFVQSCQQIEAENYKQSQSQGESEIQFQNYLRSKQSKINVQKLQSDNESISSNEFIEMMQKLRNKKQYYESFIEQND